MRDEPNAVARSDTELAAMRHLEHALARVRVLDRIGAVELLTAAGGAIRGHVVTLAVEEAVRLGELAATAEAATVNVWRRQTSDAEPINVAMAQIPGQAAVALSG